MTTLEKHTIPRKYAGKDVLYDILLIAIRDNWDRCRYEYETVLDYLEKNGKDRDVDRAMLARLRQDIKNDGIEFLNSPDGLASRLKDYIVDSFPRCFE